MKSGDISTTPDAERRAFLSTLAATTAALAVAGCGGTSLPSWTNSAPAAPVWQPLATITFTEGVASIVSVASYVTDANGDALTLTRNSVALPAGVTFDAANKRFVYDGLGAVATTTGHVLTADDGQS